MANSVEIHEIYKGATVWSTKHNCNVEVLSVNLNDETVDIEVPAHKDTVSPNDLTTKHKE